MIPQPTPLPPPPGFGESFDWSGWLSTLHRQGIALPNFNALTSQERGQLVFFIARLMQAARGIRTGVYISPEQNQQAMAVFQKAGGDFAALNAIMMRPSAIA